VVACADGDDDGHYEPREGRALLKAEHLANELAEDLRIDFPQHAQCPRHLCRPGMAAEAETRSEITGVGRREAPARAPDAHTGTGHEADRARQPAPAQYGQSKASACRYERQGPDTRAEQARVLTREAQAHHPAHGVAN